MTTKDLKREAASTPPAWDATHPRESLQALFTQFVLQPITATINWYFDKRGRKKTVGFLIRLAAIVSAGAGALIPILAELLGDPKGQWTIRPGWASVALIVGAGLVWVDRFLGATSGWLRYMNTGLVATDLRDAAVLRWRQIEASWGAIEPDAQKISEALAAIKELNQQAHAIVQEETKAWMAEFQKSIDQLDSMLQTRAAHSEKVAQEALKRREQHGSVTVVITNAAAIEPGCTVSAEGVGEAAVNLAPQPINGDRVVFVGLAVGMWKFVAHGVAKDAAGSTRRVADEVATIVKADEITKVEVTLR